MPDKTSKTSRGNLDHSPNCSCTRCLARRRGYNLQHYSVKLPPDVYAAVRERGQDWVREVLAREVAR